MVSKCNNFFQIVLLSFIGTTFASVFEYAPIAKICHLTSMKVSLPSNEQITLEVFDSRSNFLSSDGDKIILPGLSSVEAMTEYCFYQGKVQNDANSMVVLDQIGSKIHSGIINYKSKMYSLIQQDAYSPVFKAIVKPPLKKKKVFHQDSDEVLTVKTAAPERSKRSKRSTSKLDLSTSGYNMSSQVLYIELILLGDHEFVKKAGGKAKAEQRLVSIGNYVNALYRKLNSYVFLVDLRAWSEKDEFVIDDNPEVNLNRLGYHRMTNNWTNHDAMHLITSKQLSGGFVGKAKGGAVCQFEQAYGLDFDNADDAYTVSTTVAHEMGHNMGLLHDEVVAGGCICDDKDGCIMSQVNGLVDPVDWSRCSIRVFHENMATGMSYCLHDPPTRKQITFNATNTCGNFIVDPGEDCDCGPVHYRGWQCGNDCCEPTTCKFKKPSYTCASGECCDIDTCMKKAAGTECRHPASQCDLPEYCSGNSTSCPSDVFKANGAACNSTSGNSGFCYDGNCPSHNDQCKQIFGPMASSAFNICYMFLNLGGTDKGHCGIDKTSIKFELNPGSVAPRVEYRYHKCSSRNTKCGTVQCKGFDIFEHSQLWRRWSTIHENMVTDEDEDLEEVYRTCLSGLHNVKFTGLRNPNLVYNGAKCSGVDEPDAMCVDAQCVAVAEVYNITTTTPRPATTTTMNLGKRFWKTRVVFSASYKTTVESVGKSKFLKNAKPQFAKMMKVKEPQITKFNCSAGSIIFDMTVQDSGEANGTSAEQAYRELSKLQTNNDLRILTEAGDFLQAISLTGEEGTEDNATTTTTTLTPFTITAPPTEDDLTNFIIMTSSAGIGGIILCIVLVASIYYCCVKKTACTSDSPPHHQNAAVVITKYDPKVIIDLDYTSFHDVDDCQLNNGGTYDNPNFYNAKC